MGAGRIRLPHSARTAIGASARTASGDTPETSDAAPAAGTDDTGPLAIGVADAVLLALELNPSFALERLGPARAATHVDEAAAAFDPELTAGFTDTRSDDVLGPGSLSKTRAASVGASVALPTGTALALEAEHGLTNSGFAPDTDDARVGVSVTQPLMRGASRAANLAVVRQAGLDAQASEFELRGAAEALVADVEKAYWNHTLAGERIAIYEESLRLAEKQIAETRVRIETGKLAGTELAAARAEAASRADALIGARGALGAARIRLLQLLGPPGAPPFGDSSRFWSREVTPLEKPVAPEAGPGDVERHVAKALSSRADLGQARLAVERGEIELVRTRNGLLPRLDLFIHLGRTGYADSFSGAFKDLDDGYDVSGGIVFEHALGRRGARARRTRAEISRVEAGLALENLARLAQVDVRTAHIACVTSRERIAATAAAGALQREVLRSETEKFRVGKSTSFQVAQAQRDLVSAKLAEVEAVVGYLQALVELYRADGSLLERRGLAAGAAPSR
jgi:outer membrane protein TolC